MDILLLAFLSLFSFNMESMNVTLQENNIYVTDKYPILIKTSNCQEIANQTLSWVTFNENDIYTPKQIQFMSGVTCQIISIEEKPWPQS